MEIKHKITLLLQYFYPDVAGTGQQMTELCIELAKKGLDVTVFTSHPSYFELKKTSDYEIYKDIKIHRICRQKFNKIICMNNYLICLYCYFINNINSFWIFS